MGWQQFSASSSGNRLRTFAGVGAPHHFDKTHTCALTQTRLRQSCSQRNPRKVSYLASANTKSSTRVLPHPCRCSGRLTIVPLVGIGLKLKKDTIKDDAARLRANIKESSTATNGRSPSRNHGVVGGLGDGCSGGSSAYGGSSSIDSVGSYISPRRKRDGYDVGDVSAKRLRNELSGGGGSGGLSSGGGAPSGSRRGNKYCGWTTRRSGAVFSTLGIGNPSRKRLGRDADDDERKATKRNRHEKSGSDDSSASREEGSSSVSHSTAHRCATNGNESGANATSANNKSDGESSVPACRGNSGGVKHQREGSG